MERTYFHEGLIQETEEGPYLVGKKCTRCGRIQFPHGKLCAECLGKERKDVLIGKTGKLYSFTTTYGPVAKLKPPLTVGYIQIPEGLRIFAPLKDDGRPFTIGMDMELELTDLWEEDGVKQTAYRYKAAENAETRQCKEKSVIEGGKAR